MTATLAGRSYVAAIEKYASGRLVDLGCGQVPLFEAYGPLVYPITCVDWPGSPHDIQHADVEADLNVAPWPLPDAGFDTALLTDVLEHIARPDVVWAELARIVAPGGVVILGVPFAYWLHEEPHDYHRYTEHRLRMFCDDHGFEVEQLAPYGGSVHVIADMAGKTIAGYPRLARFVPAVQRAGLRLGRPDRKMPLGYTLVARKK